MFTELAQTVPWARGGAAGAAAGAGAGGGGEYGPLPAILFFVFAGMTVGSAYAVAFSRNIVRAAVWLLFALSGMAGLYFLLAAEFLAAVQLVVYVGGTLVLMVFGVMLTSKSPRAVYGAKRWEVVWGVVVAGVIGVPRIFLCGVAPWAVGGGGAAGPTVEDIGSALLSARGFLVPFELVSVLLLAVMIGAAYLAKSRRGGKA